jgi:hypothetical protein
VDRRHDRRELTAEELRRLLDVTRTSAKTFRGLHDLAGAVEKTAQPFAQKRTRTGRVAGHGNGRIHYR